MFSHRNRFKTINKIRNKELSFIQILITFFTRKKKGWHHKNLHT